LASKSRSDSPFKKYFFLKEKRENKNKQGKAGKMPPAGNLAADRARAHYRWAQRYAKAGNPQKSITHMGRALDYDSSAFADSAASTASTFGVIPFDSVQLHKILNESNVKELTFNIDGNAVRLEFHKVDTNVRLLYVDVFNEEVDVLSLSVTDHREDDIRSLPAEHGMSMSGSQDKRLVRVIGMLGSMQLSTLMRYLSYFLGHLIQMKVISHDSIVMMPVTAYEKYDRDTIKDAAYWWNLVKIDPDSNNLVGTAGKIAFPRSDSQRPESSKRARD
jgi:hypothetical protein